MEHNNFEILSIDKSHLKRVSMLSRSIEDLMELVSKHNNDLYGIGNWLVIPNSVLPSDFSVETYTIVDGKLVPAPAEVLEARQAARLIAQAEEVRAARESRYRAETDTLMFDAIEAYALAHPDDPAFAAWLEAKDRIRQELPKPQEGGANE